MTLSVWKPPLEALAIGQRYRIRRPVCLSGIFALLLAGPVVQAASKVDIRGNVTLEAASFPNSPIHLADQRSNLSVSGEIEWHYPVGDNGALTITPFARLDEHDNNRSHFDFRELNYSYYRDNWEYKIGLSKVFWGVTESLNVVDIINQPDSIEDDDSSAKLGQPMVNVNYLLDWGSIEFYLLTGFRERTLAGINGRPRLPYIFGDARYESDDEDRHIDFATRISGSRDAWDLGVHVFHGTAREPLYRPEAETGRLAPYYYQQTQLGFSAQATFDSWLLKAELVSRWADAVDDHIQTVSGFEYTFFDIQGRGFDIGVIGEHLYDNRQYDAEHPFQNDLLLGFRLALNDRQSTDALVGVIADLDEDGHIITIESSRRIGSSFKASALLRIWEPASEFSSMQAMDNEDYLRLKLGYYF